MEGGREEDVGLVNGIELAEGVYGNSGVSWHFPLLVESVCSWDILFFYLRQEAPKDHERMCHVIDQ